MKTTTKLGNWHAGIERPTKDGWYLRDYRNPTKPTKSELPPFSVDKYLCHEDGGFWYVLDGDDLNDAFYENLPWCKIK